MFKGFRPTLGYGLIYCVFCFCWCSRRFFVFFSIFGFLDCLFGFVKTFGKTKKTYPRVSLKPLNTFWGLFLMFVCCFLWFSLVFWLSRMICWFCKNLRENKKKQQKEIYPRVSLKPFKQMFCWLFLMCFWCSLVFFGIFGFPEGFFGFLKSFGKTKKNKQKKYISKGESETFKNFVVLVVPNIILVFFGFLLYFWFSQRFCWFSKILRENKKTNPYPRVSLKPLKTLFFWLFLMFCLFSLVFFGIFGFLN